MDGFRATSWSEFIGQEDMKRRLGVHIAGAKKRNEPLDHVFLAGPPGFGKTTMAAIIAGEIGNDFEAFTMPLDERRLSKAIINFSGVLFLDEIHRATKSQQETMLSLLEFGFVQNKFGYRSHAGLLTVVGATTERDKVIPSLYDRFPIKPLFVEYSDEEMEMIVIQMAFKAGIDISGEDAEKLGRATGGIPRVALQYIVAARDLEAIGAQSSPDSIFDLCQVDEIGLSIQHYAYLSCLKQNDYQAGLRTLQSNLRVNESMIRELERLLMKYELVVFTDRGRRITEAGLLRLEKHEA